MRFPLNSGQTNAVKTRPGPGGNTGRLLKSRREQKGCTRDVQGIDKGCTRVVQGNNTVATPAQYRSNTGDPRCHPWCSAVPVPSAPDTFAKQGRRPACPAAQFARGGVLEGERAGGQAGRRPYFLLAPAGDSSCRRTFPSMLAPAGMTLPVPYVPPPPRAPE